MWFPIISVEKINFNIFFSRILTCGMPCVLCYILCKLICCIIFGVSCTCPSMCRGWYQKNMHGFVLVRECFKIKFWILGAYIHDDRHGYNAVTECFYYNSSRCSCCYLTGLFDEVITDGDADAKWKFFLSPKLTLMRSYVTVIYFGMFLIFYLLLKEHVSVLYLSLFKSCSRCPDL